MNSIRGRILLALFILGFLIMPFVIFSYNSIKKINSGKALKEQVALFNINRLKANNAFNHILDTDTKIDSFYLTKSSQHRKQYQEFIQLAENALEEIKEVDYQKDPIVARRIVNIQTKIGKLHRLSDAILTLRLERGFRDFGLEGTMRKYIHQLENVEALSLSENLSLRRREKDYFLRDDLQYAQLLNEEVQLLLERMAAKRAKNEEAIAILKGYRDGFNAIVAIESEIGNENKGMLYEYYGLNNELGVDVSTLYEVVDTNLLLQTNSIKSYILLFFLITAVFAMVFSIVFSGHISKPIQNLITDMNLISEKKFKGNTLVSSDVNVNEIKQLTATYNELIDKIRSQISDLNDKNEELEILNQKLKESEDELKEASRVKDRFFSIISHDLRGHTGNVLSLSKILGEESMISEKEKEVFTKYLVDTSQNLQLLLDNLLQWAKSQMNDHELSKKSFRLQKLIEQNILLYQDNAKRKGVHVLYKPKEVPKAYADKDMIDFILRNLLSNALKFTKRGDRITFSVEEQEHFLQVQIKDTGVGMQKSQIKRLLNENRDGFTTKGTQNEVGTGLGFSICMDFIKRNGGEMQIDSEVGKGSTFTFTIPTSLTKNSIMT